MLACELMPKKSRAKNSGRARKKAPAKSARKKYTLHLAILLVIIAVTAGALWTYYDIMAAPQDASVDAPKIYATIISYAGCEKCSNASMAIPFIRSLGAKVIVGDALEISSEKAKWLIDEYGITKAPAIIFSGEIEKSGEVRAALLSIGAMRGEKIVLTKIAPPYYDTKSGKVVGIVDATAIEDNACSYCFSPASEFLPQLEALGVVFGKQNTLEAGSKEGTALAAKYNVSAVPALVLSSSISAYEGLQDGLLRLGKYEAGGSYVFRASRPPYRNLSTGNIEGAVKITYVTDASCNECYNVSMHNEALGKMGIYLVQEEWVDAKSAAGKSIISKYNITIVPTILLSKEASMYFPLMQAWAEVGTIESDGSFVFRNAAAIGPSKKYRDLASGKIIGGANSTE